MDNKESVIAPYYQVHISSRVIAQVKLITAVSSSRKSQRIYLNKFMDFKQLTLAVINPWIFVYIIN